jgi:HAMP domain-containing protein
MFRPSGLRFKLTAALISVVVLTVGLTGYLSITWSYRALKAQRQEGEMVLANAIAGRVDYDLAQAREALRVLSSHPEIQSMDPRRQENALDFVDKVMDLDLIDEIFLLDARGRLTVRDRVMPDIRRVLPSFPYQELADAAGGSTEPSRWRTYLSRSREPVAAVSVPVLRDGRIIGTLVGTCLLKEHHIGGVDGFHIGSTGSAFIVDSKGEIIMHRQKERLLEDISGRPLTQAVLQARRGVIEFRNRQGIPVLAAFAPTQEAEWFVIVHQHAAESYAFATRLRTLLVVVFFSGLIGIIFVSIFLANWIAKPVTEIMDAILQVAEGDLAVETKVESHDEIGTLADSFNEMARRLEKKRVDTAAAYRKLLVTQTKLAQSEKRAAISRLAAGLAHELNDPLTKARIDDLIREAMEGP